MAANAPIEIASAIQSASINRHPSPTHDINPSTAASKKEPVRIAASHASSVADEDEIPLSVLDPVPRRTNLPPLPDLRFEQSYLKSIEKASGWMGWRGIGWITFRDQVLFPLLQGTAWALLLHGWRHLNRSTQFSGHSVGARLRRWWWGVNNWKLPPSSSSTESQTTRAKLGSKKLAGRVEEYYKVEFASAGSD